MAARSLGRYAVGWQVGHFSGLHAPGGEPLQQSHDELVKPIAVRVTRGAWYQTRRLVSLDDSTLDVADEKIIEDALSRLGASRGASAYPQIRFVSLVENGTHVLFCSQTEGCRTGEIRLPKVVLPHLKKGMLCLADRNFFGFELWQLRSRLARRQQFCIAVGSVRASPFTLCAIYNAIQFLLGLRKTGFPAQRNAEVVFMPGQFVSVIGARKFGWRLIVLVGGILNVSSLHSSGDTV